MISQIETLEGNVAPLAGDADPQVSIIVDGNLETGFSFLGPFPSLDDANSYALDKLGAEWTVIALRAPDIY